jgi:hypothetical protein
MSKKMKVKFFEVRRETLMETINCRNALNYSPNQKTLQNFLKN